MESNTFVPPSAKTVNELLEQYMSIYGVNAWAMSTYEAKKATISHYISPVIGDMKLEDVTPMVIDRYYKELQKMKQVGSKYHHPREEYPAAFIDHMPDKGLQNGLVGNIADVMVTFRFVDHIDLCTGLLKLIGNAFPDAVGATCYYRHLLVHGHPLSPALSQ